MEEPEGMEDVDEAAADAPPITEYEQQRLQLIQRNRDVLAKLQCENLAASLEPVASSVRKKDAHKNKTYRSGGVRRSQRLSAIKATSIKVVDWSSGSSEELSESESDDTFLSKLRGNKFPRKKNASLAEYEDAEKKKEDVEYVPTESSASEDSAEEEEPEGDPRRGYESPKSKAPAKRSRGKTLRSTGQRTASLKSPSRSSPRFRPGNDVDDDDEYALQQALALSMGATLDTVPSRASKEIKGEPSSKSPRSQTGMKEAQRGRSKMKRNRERNFKISEIDALFVSMVGSQKGGLSVTQLEKAAASQDFTWTEEQLQDMIYVFDKDNDGQLNLAEFRSMAERCKLMEAC